VDIRRHCASCRREPLRHYLKSLLDGTLQINLHIANARVREELEEKATVANNEATAVHEAIEELSRLPALILAYSAGRATASAGTKLHLGLQINIATLVEQTVVAADDFLRRIAHQRLKTW